MITVPYVEFYITNHCNMNCKYCNRFNNYNFKGHYSWDEYKDTYKRWAEHIKFKSIGILGGEPLMHPDIENWLTGIRSLWPTSNIRITSNGTLLGKNKNLYKLARDLDIKIVVSVHNFNDMDSSVQSLDTFYPDNFTVEQNMLDKVFFARQAVDESNVKVIINKFNSMHQSTVINQNGILRLHNSAPELAHKTCDMKSCHTIVNGKIYKCAIPIVLSEFNKQHAIELDQIDKNILDNTGGYTIDDVNADPDKFLNYLKNPIPQCKFCPEEYVYKTIEATIGNTPI